MLNEKFNTKTMRVMPLVKKAFEDMEFIPPTERTFMVACYDRTSGSVFMNPCRDEQSLKAFTGIIAGSSGGMAMLAVLGTKKFDEQWPKAASFLNAEALIENPINVSGVDLGSVNAGFEEGYRAEMQ